MLFILIMEPLQQMFELATSRGIMSPLAWRGMEHHLSMFVDDVMVFLNLWELDVEVFLAILVDFGISPGMRINHGKCMAMPIKNSDDVMALVSASLRCISLYPHAQS